MKKHDLTGKTIINPVNRKTNKDFVKCKEPVEKLPTSPKHYSNSDKSAVDKG